MKLTKNITIDEEVYNRISEYAKENGISFSGALSVLAGQALQAVKGVESIKQLTDMMEMLQKQSGTAGGDTPPKAELGGEHAAGAGADPARGAGGNRERWGPGGTGSGVGRE